MERVRHGEGGGGLVLAGQLQWGVPPTAAQKEAMQEGFSFLLRGPLGGTYLMYEHQGSVRQREVSGELFVCKDCGSVREAEELEANDCRWVSTRDGWVKHWRGMVSKSYDPFEQIVGGKPPGQEDALMWVYKLVDGRYHVGYYSPDREWHFDSDWATREEATQRVRWLNGGSA